MNNYEVIVIGAGHAGIEASLACARLGIRIGRTPNAFTMPVADSVMGYILAEGRKASGILAEERGLFPNWEALEEAQWLYDHFVDHDVFSLLRREWLSQTK